MSKIRGYFLYRVYKIKDISFVYPVHLYDTLQGAKKSCVINRYNDWDGAFVIVPIYDFFDSTSPIKYMWQHGKWSKDLNQEYCSVFYKWRNGEEVSCL